MRRRLWILTAAAVLVVLFADARAGDTASDSLAFRSLRADLLYGEFDRVTENRLLFSSKQATVHTRNIPLAFGLSAAVPGLGQAYNGSWIRSAIAVAAEAGLLTAYFVWQRNGEDGRDRYQEYAHDFWSPVRYAEWLNDYSGYLGEAITIPDLVSEEIAEPETWSPAERAAVDALISDIRNAERRSTYLTTGAAFSHTLPDFGEQQYYELIGKYFQYAPGWNDYDASPDANPEQALADDARFFFYSDIHAAANDDLRRARTAGVFLLVNHFIAAVDAAVTAKRHNQRVETSLRLRPDRDGSPMAQATVLLNF